MAHQNQVHTLSTRRKTSLTRDDIVNPCQQEPNVALRLSGSASPEQGILKLPKTSTTNYSSWRSSRTFFCLPAYKPSRACICRLKSDPSATSQLIAGLLCLLQVLDASALAFVVLKRSSAGRSTVACAVRISPTLQTMPSLSVPLSPSVPVGRQIADGFP